MAGISVHERLWQNVQALMRKHYGEVNISRLAREAKLGNGTIQRMREAETDIGLGVLNKVARRFGLEEWQLLVAGLDADSEPPQLMILSLEERRLIQTYRSLDETMRPAVLARADALHRAQQQERQQHEPA